MIPPTPFNSSVPSNTNNNCGDTTHQVESEENISYPTTHLKLIDNPNTPGILSNKPSTTECFINQNALSQNKNNKHHHIKELKLPQFNIINSTSSQRISEQLSTNDPHKNNIISTYILDKEKKFNNPLLIRKKPTISENPKEIGDLFLASAIKESEACSITKTYKRKLFVYNIIITILSTLSIILSVFDAEVYLKLSMKDINTFRKGNKYNNSYLEQIQIIKNRNLSKSENILRCVNIVISFINVIVIIVKSKIEFTFKKLKSSQDTNGDISNYTIEGININNQYIAMNNNNSNNPLENSKTNMITMNLGERSHSTIHLMNHNNSNSRNRLFAINILNSSFTGGNNNSSNNNNGYTPIQIKRSFWKFLLKKRLPSLLIAMIIYPPYVNHVFIIKHDEKIYSLSLSHVFVLFTLGKIYIIVATLRDISLWTRTIDHAICKSFKYKASLWFIIKSYLHYYPLFSLVIIYVIFVLLMTQLIRMLEFAAFNSTLKQEENDFIELGSWTNACWVIATSTFSISSGGFYPKTLLGKTISFVNGIFGMVISALFILNFLSLFTLHADERKAYLKLKKLYNPENNRHKAVNVIRKVLLMHKLGKEKKINDYNREQIGLITNDSFFAAQKKDLHKRLFMFLVLLKKDINDFKDNYKIARTFAISVDDLIIHMIKKISDNLAFFNGHLSKLEGLETNLRFIANMQEETYNDLTKVIKYQNELKEYLVTINNNVVKTKAEQLLRDKALKVHKKMKTSIKLNSMGLINNLVGNIALKKRKKKKKLNNKTMLSTINNTKKLIKKEELRLSRNYTGENNQIELLKSNLDNAEEIKDIEPKEQQDKQYYHAVKHMATNIISNQNSKKNVLSKYGLKLDTLHESEIDDYIKEESIDDK